MREEQQELPVAAFANARFTAIKDCAICTPLKSVTFSTLARRERDCQVALQVEHRVRVSVVPASTTVRSAT